MLWLLERDRRHFVPVRNRAYVARRRVGEKSPDRVEPEVPRCGGALLFVLEMAEEVAPREARVAFTLSCYRDKRDEGEVLTAPNLVCILVVRWR